MVLAVVDDLLFGSKLRAAAGHAGQPITFARKRDEVMPALLGQRPDVVIFDLDRDLLDPIGLIREIRSNPEWADLRLAGFASHVHVDRLREARDAGCNAMARSAFVTAMPVLMKPPTDMQED